jgi:hypothetical protein
VVSETIRATVSLPPVAAGEHAAWLLELGAAARADEARPVLRRGLGAWAVRRARARARRARIRERIEAAAFDAFELQEREIIDEHLLERISIYTHGEAAQPALTASLRATVTGPGLAAPTTQTENL